MNTVNQEDKPLTTPESTVQNKQVVLEISSDIKSNLQIAGGWAQFLAIVGFIGMGFMVIAGIGMSIVMSVIPNAGTEAFPFPPALLGLIYIIFAFVYLFPVLYLLRFSTRIKQALAENNQEHLSKAFSYLKSHYKSIGIIMIVFLCLYPILMIGMVLFGVFSGMGANSGFPV